MSSPLSNTSVSAEQQGETRLRSAGTPGAARLRREAAGHERPCSEQVRATTGWPRRANVARDLNEGANSAFVGFGFTSGQLDFIRADIVLLGMGTANAGVLLLHTARP